jgi:F-type H+-transporting ATPase subunit delta
MSDTHTARIAELDSVADAYGASPDLADDLFAVVGLLEGEPTLRRNLSDPAAPQEARAALVQGLLGSRVSLGAIEVLKRATGLRWGNGVTLTGALERQAVRSVIGRADAEGRLDEVEGQLFGILTLVRQHPELSRALADRSRSLADREQLLRGLVADRVAPEVVKLALRAVGARRRTVELTLEEYLRLAAQRRRRGIAQIRVAQPLSAEQTARLRAALVAQTGRPLTLEITVDPRVIGGAKVTIGDEVIDGTVSSRLEAARRAFV